MKHTLALAVMTLLVAFGLSAPAAHADSVIFTLSNPIQSVGASGGTVTYEATVSAPSTNGAAVNLNGDQFTFPLALDDSDFFVFWPFFLNPGDSFTGDLFTITVPAGATAGDYVGTFSLLGGVGFSNDVLGTETITANVVAPTPEPSAFLLLGTGLTGAVACFKKRRTSRI